MKFKIERGVPIPEVSARQGDNMELLKTMQPGDSVYFDTPIVKKASRFYRVAKKLGVNIIIRKDGEGMRMWKVDSKATAGAAPAAAGTVVLAGKRRGPKRAEPKAAKVVPPLAALVTKANGTKKPAAKKAKKVAKVVAKKAGKKTTATQARH